MTDEGQQPDAERVSSHQDREIDETVELYVSNAAGANLRKHVPERKKTDKRGSASDDYKLREKSSFNWVSQHKGLTSAGHWRPARIKLREEGERCLLNVYVDNAILFQTVTIHLLNQTDIRPTDNSMFYRKDCLGIFAISGQRWTTSNTIEPLYLHFPSSEMCMTWQALLKSYAIPEIYGRWFFPSEGGSYRMWRQVELSVIQGRHLGQKRYDPGGQGIDRDDSETTESDVSCEVHLNDILSSRTTAKKGSASPEWHESFTYSDLPPFDALEIVVWKERKLYKPVAAGRTRINLGNFRRGDTVEGWFPVLQAGPSGSDIQAGELRLKIRVDEEIILPRRCYLKLMETCNSRSFLDWMTDLETRLKLKTISSHLMAVAVATDVAIAEIQKYAIREVGNSTSHQTLFRGNTTLTKTVELCMTWYGKSFLEASIGPVLRKLIADKIAIEVDPMRLTGKGSKEVDRNVDLLLLWCQRFWDQIYSVRRECPNELRKIFQTIRKLVEQRYKPEPVSPPTDNPPPNYLPWQSVSAFCFLRFIVPAILHPHLFGLTAGLPPPPVQRSLTLIAKVIQSLANLNSNMQKETFMRGVQTFLKDGVDAMIDYIAVVSTPTEEPFLSTSQITEENRLKIGDALNRRKLEMTLLDHESVPNLPHLLDVPKHLAIITSAVIRSSRELSSIPRTGDDTDLAVDEFCSRCFEVEEEALQRVSSLASKLKSNDPADRPTRPFSDSGHSSEVVTTISVSNPASPRTRKTSRPTTAPGPSGPSTPRRQPYSPTVHAVTSPRAFANILPEEQRVYTTHPEHSTSTPQSVHTTYSAVQVHAQSDFDDPAKKKKGILNLRGILKR